MATITELKYDMGSGCTGEPIDMYTETYVEGKCAGGDSNLKPADVTETTFQLLAYEDDCKTRNDFYDLEYDDSKTIEFEKCYLDRMKYVKSVGSGSKKAKAPEKPWKIAVSLEVPTSVSHDKLKELCTESADSLGLELLNCQPGKKPAAGSSSSGSSSSCPLSAKELAQVCNGSAAEKDTAKAMYETMGKGAEFNACLNSCGASTKRNLAASVAQTRPLLMEFKVEKSKASAIQAEVADKVRAEASRAGIQVAEITAQSKQQDPGQIRISDAPLAFAFAWVSVFVMLRWY